MANKLKSNDGRLVEWIKKNSYTERDEGQFVKVVVRQVTKGKPGDEILTVNVTPQSERGDDWERDLANDILNTLHAEAAQFTGIQQYACYSKFSDAENFVNRCVLTIQGAASEDDDGLMSEAPDATGLAAQAMRHQEVNARLLVAGTSQLLDSYRRMNERLLSMNETLMGQRMEHFETMAEVLEERNKLTIEQLREQAKTDAMKEGLGMVKTLLPPAINKLVGTNVFPEESRAKAKSVGKNLFGSLTKEQVEALQNVLKPDQLMNFFTLGEMFVDEE